MKTVLHKSNTRGHVSMGWLNSFHSFSFGHYQNPERMHFGALRVLNDDTVAAGMGFGKHPHENMEIVSIPLEGGLRHSDSTGREVIIREYDVQIMSAGEGIMHSEMNANKDKPVKFLQIWVMPREYNIVPRYQQKSFKPEDRLNKILNVVAPDNNDAVWINQDAWFSLANLKKEFVANYQLHNKNNGVYIFVIKGEVEINNEPLQEHDGLGIWETEALKIKASSDTDILLIEVPIK